MGLQAGLSLVEEEKREEEAEVVEAEAAVERLLEAAVLNSEGSGLEYLPSLQLCNRASANWQHTALRMSLVESDSSAIRIDLHLEIAFEARPAFMCIFAAWYNAVSKIGLSRSLGVFKMSTKTIDRDKLIKGHLLRIYVLFDIS